MKASNYVLQHLTLYCDGELIGTFTSEDEVDQYLEQHTTDYDFIVKRDNTYSIIGGTWHKMS